MLIYGCFSPQQAKNIELASNNLFWVIKLQFVVIESHLKVIDVSRREMPCETQGWFGG